MKPVKNNIRKERGQAGLELLLAVVASLFMIGIIVMVFSLAGSEILDAVSLASPNSATAQNAINDTTTSLAGVTDWFPVIIVLAAVVVLVLMVVLIIRAVRNSGIQGA